MLDMKTFGEKLRNHRKNLNLTQEQVAEKIGVSGQAVSKWESGDCLPDCFNLKALGDVYGISLDILLETSICDDIDVIAAKIEQLGDEFVWSKASRNEPYAHRDLGEDLWKMWKGLYFIEVGNKEFQERDKNNGNLRICSDYGMKIWDEDGVACIVKSSIKDNISDVKADTLHLMREMCSEDCFKLISILDAFEILSKSEISEKLEIDPNRLNELLLYLMENKIIEFVSSVKKSGYKIHSHVGISAYMILAIARIISKPCYSVSEYVKNYN